ncbi:MAG TPA: hypothetical protein PKW35_19890, partial [Nannocystaceae bacterium]|nr:hypothetical protein [Nannocystaceae bacterium]
GAKETAARPEGPPGASLVLSTPGPRSQTAAAADSSGPAEAAAPPVDPSWFRADLFAGATVIKKGHTRADAEGKISAQITLQLADGTTREACIDTLRAAVAADVPKLDELKADDRTTLTGDAGRYVVTLICGEAKGHMTAFLSWRGLPTE